MKREVKKVGKVVKSPTEERSLWRSPTQFVIIEEHVCFVVGMILKFSKTKSVFG